MTSLMTKLPYGLAGTIYRSALPFSPLFDPDHHLLDLFVEAGVDVVVMLTPADEVWDLTRIDLKSRYKALGFQVIYSPVVDFSVPDSDAFQDPIQKVLAAAHQGQTVVIHCHAGWGRTGIFTACLAKVVFNMSGEKAIAWVRQFIPDAVENWQQFQFVLKFEYPLD